MTYNACDGSGKGDCVSGISLDSVVVYKFGGGCIYIRDKSVTDGALGA